MFEKYLPENIAVWLDRYGAFASDITLCRNKNMYISKGGVTEGTEFFIDSKLFDIIISRMCNGSIYAKQETLKEGYIMLEGGHRIGVTGTIVTNEKSSYLRDITAVNIRVARNITDAAEKAMKYITDGRRLYNTLIVAPPAKGKTTMLKALIDRLGESFRVGVVDERDELIQGNEGDGFVFSVKGVNKYDGILMLLRSMAPEVIITDEIGTECDETAIYKLINAGVKVVCTAHGYDETDILRRDVFKRLVYEKVFEKIIILSEKRPAGSIEKIIDTKELKMID